jgi:predicted Zn-dependent protease
VQARQLLEAVLAAEPSHPLALRTRGQMAMTAGDLDDAEKWLREAARVAPNDYRTHYTLFQCLQQLGKQEEARSVEEHTRRLKDLLERAAEISTTRISNNPYDPALHAELGVINIHLGHKELGERWLLSALVQDPSYGPAYAALAELYEQQGDTAKAASYRRQARGAAPPAPGRPSPPPKP